MKIFYFEKFIAFWLVIFKLLHIKLKNDLKYFHKNVQIKYFCGIFGHRSIHSIQSNTKEATGDPKYP